MMEVLGVRLQIQMTTGPTRSFTPASSRLLQRKCADGVSEGIPSHPNTRSTNA
jgi:hypothetical protein